MAEAFSITMRGKKRVLFTAALRAAREVERHMPGEGE